MAELALAGDAGATSALCLKIQDAEFESLVKEKFKPITAKVRGAGFKIKRLGFQSKSNSITMELGSIAIAKKCKEFCENSKQELKTEGIYFSRKTGRAKPAASASKPAQAKQQLCKWELGEFAEEGCWAHRTGKCPNVHRDESELFQKLVAATKISANEENKPSSPSAQRKIDLGAAKRFIFHELGSKVRNPPPEDDATESPALGQSLDGEKSNGGQVEPISPIRRTQQGEQLRQRIMKRLEARATVGSGAEKTREYPPDSVSPNINHENDADDSTKITSSEETMNRNEDEGEFPPDKATADDQSTGSGMVINNRSDTEKIQTPTSFKTSGVLNTKPATPMMTLSPNQSEPVWLQESRVSRLMNSLQHVRGAIPSRLAKEDAIGKSYREQAQKFKALRPATQYPHISGIGERIEMLKSLDARELEAQTNLALRNKNDLNSGFVVGSCMDMCPETERYVRMTTGYGTGEGYVHWLECEAQSPFVKSVLDHSRAVKAYRKEAADNAVALASQLRPESVLHRTMLYLCVKVMAFVDSDLFANNADEERVMSARAQWHKFLEDRTRGIRKDMSIQQILTPGGALILERIIRFHIFAGHYMCGNEEYVDQQNSEQMKKAFKTLRDLYCQLRRTHGPQPNEAEFRAYDILANLHDPSAMGEVRGWPNDVVMSNEVQFAIKIFSTVQRGSGSLFNYAQFFKLAKDTTVLNACLLNNHFNWVRRQALRIIQRSFGPGETLVAISTLTKMLGFDDDDAAIRYIQSFSMNCVNGFVSFNRSVRLDDGGLAPEKEFVNWIEGKRKSTLGELVYGKVLPKFSMRAPSDTFSTVRLADEIEVPADTAVVQRVASDTPSLGRSRKRSLAQRLGMDKESALETSPGKRARDAFAEKAAAERKLREERQREAAAAEARRREEALKKVKEEKERAERARLEAAKAKAAAEKAKAEAEAEVRRLATIAKAEAEARAAEEARVAAAARAAEEERQRLLRAAEEEHRRQEKARQLYLDKAANLFSCEIIDSTVLSFMETLATAEFKLEIDAGTMLNGLIGESIFRFAVDIARECHAAELKLFRLAKLETSFRRKRVFHAWAEATKRRAALRVVRRPAVSTLQKWSRSGRARYVPKHEMLVTDRMQDTQSQRDAQEMLSAEFERRAEITRLRSLWTPVDVAQIVASRSWRFPPGTLGNASEYTVAVCPARDDNSMLYNYVHARLSDGIDRACDAPAESVKMQERLLHSGEQINVQWIGEPARNTINSYGAAAIMFLVSIEAASESTAICRPANWPTEDELSLLGVTFAGWLRSNGERVPHGINDTRRWWWDQSQLRLRAARARELTAWEEARQRLVDMVDGACDKSCSRGVAVAVIYSVRKISGVRSYTNSIEGTMQKLGLTELLQSGKVRAARCFEVDPATDADERSETVGQLENSTWWLLSKSLERDPLWRGKLNVAVELAFEGLKSRSGNAASRPSFAIEIYNAALGVLSELLSNEARQAQLMNALESDLIGVDPEIASARTNAHAIALLTELRLPPLDIDRFNDRPGLKSETYFTLALPHLKENSVEWKIRHRAMIDSEGIDKFAISDRLTHSEAKDVDVRFHQNTLDTILREFGEALRARTNGKFESSVSRGVFEPEPGNQQF